MAVNNQFSIAVHLMAGLGFHAEGTTSTELAASVNASPSFIRRTLSKLAKAKLVRTTTGKTGASTLAKDPEEISLLNIYEAVEAPKAFSIHKYPMQRSCFLSCHIKTVLENVLDTTQRSMEESLKGVSLADVIADTRKT